MAAKSFSLGVPQTIAQIEAEFANRWADFRAKRDRAVSRKLCLPEDRAMFASLDGGSNPPSCFLASNGPARAALFDELAVQYEALRNASPPYQFLHVTIADGQWATSDERTRIQLAAIKSSCRPILSRISKHWIAVGEVQAFSNVPHPKGGKLLTPHVHAICWGLGLHAAARNIAAKCNARMTAALPGVAAVKVQLIADTEIDLARVARYPLKAVDRCKNVYKNPAKGISTVNESEAGDRFVRYLRMFQILSMIEMDRLIFASGDGMRIRARAIEAARKILPAPARGAKRADDVARVAAFWDDFMPRVGLGRFRVPKIRVR